MESQKPVHTIVLDTGAIIRNSPTVSTLLAQSEQIVTVPAIITEIKDAATRSRVETTLQPFLTLRTPRPESMKFVTDFARKTGDLAVLSKPDIQICALAYELELERNGGDWRLRKNPGQKGMNGKPPVKDEENKTEEIKDEEIKDEDIKTDETKDEEIKTDGIETVETKPAETGAEDSSAAETKSESAPAQEITKDAAPNETSEDAVQHVSDDLANTKIEEPVQSRSEEVTIQDTETATTEEATQEATQEAAHQVTQETTQDATEEDSEGDDDEGWITPSNLKKHQEKDAAGTTDTSAPQSVLQVATLTTDFAMQNVLLQINLNLLSPNMQRVKHLKTYILRCHACFCTTKELSKQFCPRCGSPTLTRVACSTSSNGEFKLHLKKNMQWNTRGNKFSIPKPVHGSANGRVVGGGKGHWGNELILAEDQKEYSRHITVEQRRKERDLMDEDYLPSILTGDRNKSGGRIKVGGGRNVNSKKRN